MQTIIGKFIKSLPTMEGDSQRGHWIRGGFVVEYGDEFPRKAAFSCFGEERISIVESISPNTLVQVNYMPVSREYEGRWYTELHCQSVTPHKEL